MTRHTSLRRAFPGLCVLLATFGCDGSDPATQEDTSSSTSAEVGSSTTAETSTSTASPTSDASETGSSTATTSDGDTGSETAEPSGPEHLFERGFIAPPDSLPCYPVEANGEASLDCNHHGSSIAQLGTGEMAAVWYHGEAEKSLDVRIVWSRTDPDTVEWSEPEVLYDDPETSEGNPAVWVTETGEILVFFVSIIGDGWPETHVRMVRSDDDGGTFSPMRTLREAECWNTRQKPVRLESGELLLPLYIECLALPTFMRSSDNFVDDVRWTEFINLPDNDEYFAEHVGQIQPSLALRDDGTISAMTRNGLPSGFVREMIGDPNGENWTPSVDIELPNSGTSIDQVRLDNGHRVVIFNNSPEVRFPLSAALSTDDGQSYSSIRTLVGECDEGVKDPKECEFHYPSVTQADDGTVWVSYTHDGTTIGWVHFDEAWLAQGE